MSTVQVDAPARQRHSSQNERVHHAREFLKDILAPDRLAGFERFWLRVDGDNLAFDGFDRFQQTVARVGWHIGTSYFAPHAYLPRGKRTTENIVQICAIGIDWDDIDVDEAAERLAPLGITANWLTATRPDHAQAIIKLPPWRLAPSKHPERAAKIRQRVDRAVKDLVRVVEADTGAASINQLFRLPGSRRLIGDQIWTVRAEHVRSQPTTIAQLEAALSKRRRKQVASQMPTGEDVQTSDADSPRSSIYTVSDPNATGNCLSSPHCQWLMSRRIARGHRGNAAFKLAAAHRLDGISEDQATEQLSRWRDTSTEDGPGGDGKPFTDADIRAIVRGVYRASEPYGIDWRTSADIQDANGATMGDGTAKTIKAAMPKVARPAGVMAKPLDELQNLKAPMQLLKVLRYFAERAQAERADTITVTQTQTAQATDVPISTLKRTIWSWLHNADVMQTVQWHGTPGRARATTVDVQRLLKLSQQPQPERGGILVFVPSLFYRMGAQGIVAYWVRRLRSVLHEIAQLAESALAGLQSALGGFREVVETVTPVEPVSVEPGGRDPPDKTLRTTQTEDEVADDGDGMSRVERFLQQLRDELVAKGVNGDALEHEMARHRANLRRISGVCAV